MPIPGEKQDQEGQIIGSAGFADSAHWKGHYECCLHWTSVGSIASFFTNDKGETIQAILAFNQTERTGSPVNFNLLSHIS
jgi:hypothetical protein